MLHGRKVDTRVAQVVWSGGLSDGRVLGPVHPKTGSFECRAGAGDAVWLCAQVDRSSGHPRLDEAVLAAVRQARFKPYTENGQAVSGWALVPLEFELEQ